MATIMSWPLCLLHLHIPSMPRKGLYPGLRHEKCHDLLPIDSEVGVICCSLSTIPLGTHAIRSELLRHIHDSVYQTTIAFRDAATRPIMQVSCRFGHTILISLPGSVCIEKAESTQSAQ
ncbi:hypothetical protein E6O75_ATG07071 [Venturia nashicola]|uniref:Uncharacterized protein n=1 Tax=Venturia nashicola TaxID=86259 RepID=A0A4Z1P5S1_9PEZI|nr:hypothetical protein E6O75_ATG07071 [Venturia nashicola]